MIVFHCFKCGVKASYNAKKGIIFYNCSCWPCGFVQFPHATQDDAPTSPALPAAIPTKPADTPAELADTITPGEATRLCQRIQERINKHCMSCEYCKLVIKLKLDIRLCQEAVDLQKVLEYWEQFTLIEEDRT